MFKIEFETDNAAFEDGDCYQAVADTLSAVAQSVAGGVLSGSIRDRNGNRIGAWSLTDD